ncbi:hypothetical protein ACFYNO_37400 [Kitasatospora sp. NPDC006697]|uniref:hypothetical protein n=1 Tax=Kitasatospora sp. NPDC006697 TaxID=3364020 RepID=UPI003684AD95
MTVLSCAACGHRLTGELLERRHGAGTFRRGPDGYQLDPADHPGTAPHPSSSRRNGCCGLDGMDGPNLVCGGCGAEVGTEQSDCWTGRSTVLSATATTPLGA